MPNRLAFETSPYLQQHAENPVDWYPWGEDALAESRKTGKPILLSVGYSACHWCHVMAHESFEDEAIAGVMNELFVNIKVDREERPDIDQIYQVAQAMLTQRNGGWPLTMFLTPDQVPFFGGTYFPNAPRHGLPGFGDLLQRVRKFYDENSAEIKTQNQELVSMLGRTQPRGRIDASQLTRAPIERAVQELEALFDGEHGGFGGAPKFPHPDSIELLLRHFAVRGRGTSRSDQESAENSRVMAEFTLARMAEGGIYDQVGGGFARYSVDEQWAIPHFEKMLYDNGWLLRLYAEAWAATRNPIFERVCRETAAWVLREMQAPDGGYYSSLDADSEGEEGKFYVWTVDEISALLDPSEFGVASAVWGLDRAPNFEGKHWHLVIARTVAEVARELDMNEGLAQTHLDSARRKLRAAREERVRPGRDEKVLTSWNALMIGGMARAARVFGNPEWLASARSALEFLRATMWREGKLLATSKDGRAHLDAYLDDHAFLLAALIEMMQADFRPEDLAWATELGDLLLEEFHDPEAGGFFFTSHGHEKLIHRPKPGPDNATPSGNGVAAWALARLSFITGEMRFAEPVADTLGLFWPQIERHPSGFGSLLAALEEHLVPPRTVIVSGPPSALGEWREHLDCAFAPASMSLFIPAGTPGLPPVLDKPAASTAQAWVCEGLACLPPIATPSQLRGALELPKMPPS